MTAYLSSCWCCLFSVIFFLCFQIDYANLFEKRRQREKMWQRCDWCRRRCLDTFALSAQPKTEHQCNPKNNDGSKFILTCEIQHWPFISYCIVSRVFLLVFFLFSSSSFSFDFCIYNNRKIYESNFRFRSLIVGECTAHVCNFLCGRGCCCFLATMSRQTMPWSDDSRSWIFEEIIKRQTNDLRNGFYGFSHVFSEAVI